MRIKRPSSLNCLIISFFLVITTERKTFNFSTNKKSSKSSKSSKSLSNHLDNSNFSSKESGRKRNVYETIGRIVLATRQPEIPWKRGKKKKKKGSILHEPISLDTGQLFSLPRLWGPLPPSDNNSLTLPNNSKLLSSSWGTRSLLEAREMDPRWIREDVGVFDERFIAFNRALFDLERYRRDPLISSKSMFVTKRPSSGIFYLMFLYWDGRVVSSRKRLDSKTHKSINLIVHGTLGRNKTMLQST